MKSEWITITGAEENNLKKIDIKIPKYQLVALTGVSGSGKSSVAIDILQKECQRQYLESMGFVTDGLNKPKVQQIEGLSPSIAIKQSVLSKNPRSTVGTYTEVLTYLRILYAKLATRICPHCQVPIIPSYEEEIDDELNEKEIKCLSCKKKLKALTMASFSFNKIEGACPKCKGIGTITTADYSQLIDKSKTIAEGGFFLWGSELYGEHYANALRRCGEHYGFTFDATKKIGEFNELEQLVFYHGVDSEAFKERFPNTKKPKRVNDGYIEGVMTYVEKKIIESTTKKLNNVALNNALTEQTCDLCHGTRLGHEGLTAILNNKTITQISEYTITTLLAYLKEVEMGLGEEAKQIAYTVITDLQRRLKGIEKMGLGYLSIDRTMGTLSGGESQRLRLSSVLESRLTGVVYILDEPTTGLHPKDTGKLLEAIKTLRDLGNTVIVIEHDMSFVRACDYVIDFGPKAGKLGGEVVAYGTVEEVAASETSLTAHYLKQSEVEVNGNKKVNSHLLEVENAAEHNLKNLSVQIPLEQFVCFTGVSGSGKSTLVFDVIEGYTQGKKVKVEKIKGLDGIDQVIKIDQNPIGRMSRSNLATYTEVFTLIRELFAEQIEAKKLKLKPADFSFNVKGGRCEKCEGLGVIPLDMQFLDDVEVMCPVCKGKRFKKNVLAVTYNGKNISDVLSATVMENLLFFENHKEISHKLKTIEEVGLGYLVLGQSTTTLSGGECQRVKLAKELAKETKGHILYLLDEPTTGLHPSDTDRLMLLLKKLVAKNNSIFVIEHNTAVIAQSDYVIDMGPEGGEMGGVVVASGTPYEMTQNKASITGTYL